MGRGDYAIRTKQKQRRLHRKARLKRIAEEKRAARKAAR